MGILNTDCKFCKDMPSGNYLHNGGNTPPAGGTKDLLLTINGTPHKLYYLYNYLSDIYGPTACKMGYKEYSKRLYSANSTTTDNTPVYKIPLSGGNLKLSLKSICQYPLFGGLYPPNGPILGHLYTTGDYNSTHTGYDVTITIPPKPVGGYGFVGVGWCGAFNPGDSHFLKECQERDENYTLACDFQVGFVIVYESCLTCSTQTVETPSTRLNAIVDHQNVYWALDNGVFTDCNPNSQGTKNALDKIKAKLIEIDNFYGGCPYSSQPTVTAQAISEGQNCLLVKANGFKNKFRAIHWGGANDSTYFNHNSC